MQLLDDAFPAQIRKIDRGGTMANEHNKTRLDNASMGIGEQTQPSPSAAGGCYEIHVKDHLDSQWSDWLDGLEVKLLDNGEMILSGTIVDQAALMLVLNKLSRLNLTLISVNYVQKIERNDENEDNRNSCS